MTATTRDPAPALAADATTERVDACIVEMLYDRNLAPAVVGVPYSLALWVTWGGAPWGIGIYLWIAAKIATASFRVGLTAAFRRKRGSLRTAQWETAQVFALGIDGLVWSILGVAFAPHDQILLVGVMLVSVVAIAAVASSVLAMHFRANVAFLGGLILPAAVAQIAEGDAVGVFSGLAFLLLLALLLHGGRRSAIATRELVQLRFDMTELAQERARALAVAARSSQAKTRFIATVSHELRTPLHGILGGLRVLADSEGCTDASRARLGVVHRAAEHLLDVVTGILDFSRLEAGRVDLRDDRVDVGALLADIAALFENDASQRVAVKLGDGATEPLWVRLDEARLRQILLNLVGNAVKFTESGEVGIERTVAVGMLSISVSDTGPGIAAEELSQIFEPFHQVDDSFARRFSGTGLGLPISRDLARAMGGDIRVTSTVGAGATFVLELPFRPTSPPSEARPSVLPALAGHALVIEDNPTNVMVVTSALEKLGMAHTVALDGASGLAQLATTRPDVVLLDCHMPGMDGFEVARRIRTGEREAGGPRLPVIAVTASADSAVRVLCADAGFDEVLAKPFSVLDLATTLAAFLPSRAILRPSVSPPAGDPVGALAGYDDALARLGGDEQLFGEALRSFTAAHADSMRTASVAWADGRSVEAIRIVHTVKGLAATLGASTLHRQAAALEAAMRGDAADVTERIASADEALAEVVAAAGDLHG